MPWSDGDALSPTNLNNTSGRVYNVTDADYGAAGDGTTDDTAAIQAAIDAAGANIVFFPPGTYLVTSTITVSTTGAQLIGIGSTAGVVRFSVDHTSGPGLRISAATVTLKDFEVLGSATRKAAAAGTNYGIQLEGPDAATASLTRQYWRGVSSRDHPNHGFVLVGTVNHSMFDQLDARDNGGHGVIIDDGTSTGRTNVHQPGLVTFRHTTSTGNGGHGFVVGHEDQAFAQVPIRVRLMGYDGGPNSTDATVRFTTDDMWVFGENIDLTMCASSGTGFGVRLMGRNVRLLNSRTIGALTRGVTVGVHATADTRGVVIDGQRINTDTSLDPAIVIDAGPIRTRVRVPAMFNVTRLVDDSGTQSDIQGGSPVVTPAALAAGDNDDYDPEVSGESLESIQTLRLSADAGGSTLTGLYAVTNWTGKRIRIVNLANALTLGHQDTASVATFRMISPTGADVVMGADDVADLEYDGIVDRWRITSAHL